MHYLQIALEKQGFISHTDDQRWWFFGSSTFECVLMAQVTSITLCFDGLCSLASLQSLTKTKTGSG